MSERIAGKRLLGVALGAWMVAGAALLGTASASADDGSLTPASASAEVSSPEPTADAEISSPATPAPPAPGGGSTDGGSSSDNSGSTTAPSSDDSDTAVVQAPVRANAASTTPSPTTAADAKAKQAKDPKPGDPCPIPGAQLNDKRDRGYFTIAVANGPTATKKRVTLTFRCFGEKFGDPKNDVTHVVMSFSGKKSANGPTVAIPFEGAKKFSFRGNASTSVVDHVESFLLDLSVLGGPVNDCFIVTTLAEVTPDHSSTRGATFAIDRNTGHLGCATPKPTVSPLVVVPRHRPPTNVLPFTGSGALVSYVAVAVWLVVAGCIIANLPGYMPRAYARRH